MAVSGKLLRSSLWGYFFSTLVGALTAIASIIVILGYRGPPSFPVVRGIKITVCYPIDHDDVGDEERFLGELKERKRQIVFIDSLTIYGACWNGGSKYKPSEKVRQQEMSNDYFEYVSNDLKEKGGTIIGGTVTIGLKKHYHSETGCSGDICRVWLTVAAPQGDHFFSDAECGENCFGAHGLYRISVSSSEGYTLYRADSFPAASGIMDAYQCTIDRMSAKTWCERFAACRF